MTKTEALALAQDFVAQSEAIDDPHQALVSAQLATAYATMALSLSEPPRRPRTYKVAQRIGVLGEHTREGSGTKGSPAMGHSPYPMEL